MIELINMNAGYDGKVILHDINMRFEPGKVTALIGPNGCGKSTLFKAIVRINPHTSGRILVDGKEITNYSSKELAKKVAYLPQSRKVPDISVLSMVLHGRFAYLSYPRQYRKEDIEIARKALAWVGLSHLEEENVNRLSGGMQQKVYLAMALAQDAETILMDEPTTYLDISHQLRLMELAKKLASEGKAVVMILHDLPQALRTADWVEVLSEGRVITAGMPSVVYESGKLEAVFGVKIQHMDTETGRHYICEL